MIGAKPKPTTAMVSQNTPVKRDKDWAKERAVRKKREGAKLTDKWMELEVKQIMKEKPDSIRQLWSYLQDLGYIEGEEIIDTPRKSPQVLLEGAEIIVIKIGGKPIIDPIPAPFIYFINPSQPEQSLPNHYLQYFLSLAIPCWKQTIPSCS